MRHGEMGRHGDTAGHGHGNLLHASMLVLLVDSVVGGRARGSSSVRAVPMIQYAGVSLEGMPWLGKTLIFKRLRFQTYNLNLKPAASAVPRSRSTRPPRRFVRDMVRDRSRPHTRAHAVNTEPKYVISLHPPGRRITANPPGARRRGPHRARHMCAHHARVAALRFPTAAESRRISGYTDTR